MKRLQNYPYQLNVRVTQAMGELIEQAVEDEHEDDKTDVIRTAIAKYLTKLGYKSAS